MTTLAKGLAILGAFGKQRPHNDLVDAAAVANLSRATARRVLRTLAQLGYVDQDGRAFSLTPRVLELGFAYLSGQDWIDRALPHDEGVERAIRRILLRLDPAGHRNRLCRARAGAAHHVNRAGRRQPVAGVSYLARPRPARAILTARKSGAACDRRPSKPIRPIRSPTCRPCSIAFALTASRDFPSWTKNLSGGFARLPSRFLTAPARRSAPSISQRTRTRTTRNEMRDKFLPELKAIAQRISQAHRPI